MTSFMLENLRFNEAETSKDDAVRGTFAARLASLADLYVEDGFGSMHRKHASVYDAARLLPHAAGRLVQAEVAALSRLTGQIRRPYVVVLGGAKVTDKFEAIDGLLAIADEILVGGAMAFPFLVAQGSKVGTSLLDSGQVGAAGEYLARSGGKIMLPADLIVAAGPEAPPAEAQPEVVAATAIPADRMGLDIGPVAATSFAASLRTAGTVFWNGPMGRFEVPAYAGGTRAVARALAECGAFTVIGGGDTAAAMHELGFPDAAFGYISTGGGASLEFVAGKTLPGLAVLGDG